MDNLGLLHRSLRVCFQNSIIEGEKDILEDLVVENFFDTNTINWTTSSTVNSLYKTIYEVLKLTDNYDLWLKNIFISIENKIYENEDLSGLFDDEEKMLIRSEKISLSKVEFVVLVDILETDITLTILDDDLNIKESNTYTSNFKERKIQLLSYRGIFVYCNDY